MITWRATGAYTLHVLSLTSVGACRPNDNNTRSSPLIIRLLTYSYIPSLAGYLYIQLSGPCRRCQVKIAGTDSYHSPGRFHALMLRLSDPYMSLTQYSYYLVKSLFPCHVYDSKRGVLSFLRCVLYVLCQWKYLHTFHSCDRPTNTWCQHFWLAIYHRRSIGHDWYIRSPCFVNDKTSGVLSFRSVGTTLSAFLITAHTYFIQTAVLLTLDNIISGLCAGHRRSI